MFPLILCILSFAPFTSGETFYCQGDTSSGISIDNFQLITRATDRAQYYQPLWKEKYGKSCQFKIKPRPGLFMVEVVENELTNHNAEISLQSGGSLVLDWSVDKPLSSTSRKLAISSDKEIKVIFQTDQTYDGQPNGAGVSLKWSHFDASKCPAGWFNVSNQCIGTGPKDDKLAYYEAQKSCNSMKANLYQDTNDGYNRYNTISRSIGSSWIGINDISLTGTFLNIDGTEFVDQGAISCSSGTGPSECRELSPCVYVQTGGSRHRLLLDDCVNTREYLCSMPLGGAKQFYYVKNTSGVIELKYIILLVVLFLFIVAVVVVIVLLVYHKRRTGRFCLTLTDCKTCSLTPSATENGTTKVEVSTQVSRNPNRGADAPSSSKEKIPLRSISVA